MAVLASALAALSGCHGSRARTPVPSKAPSAKPGAATTSRGRPVDARWSPAAALADCRAALRIAQETLPTEASSKALRLACNGLVADAPCRQELRSELMGVPTVSAWTAAQRCADRYCPAFATETSLVAPTHELCARPLPFGGAPFWQANALLRGGMLAHDFARGDAQGAFEAFVAVAAYGLRVPPPRSSSTSTSAALLRVVLEPAGKLRVEGPGIDVSASSLEELPRVVPRATDEQRRIEIVAPPGIEYAEVIQVMDALHDLGYENVQFGVER